MNVYKSLTVYGLVFTCASLLLPTPLSAQERGSAAAPAATSAGPESLRLPEVVITGIDRSKIQRLIPKVTLPAVLPVITASDRDFADAFVREGDKLAPQQFRQAEERYAQALALDPANSAAYLGLGDVYRALNKYVEAAAAYEKALTIAANLPAAHYQLGLLYESRLQNPAKAIEHYQTYLQLGGADLRVKIWLRDLQRRAG